MHACMYMRILAHSTNTWNTYSFWYKHLSLSHAYTDNVISVEPGPTSQGEASSTSTDDIIANSLGSDDSSLTGEQQYAVKALMRNTNQLDEAEAEFAALHSKHEILDMCVLYTVKIWPCIYATHTHMCVGVGVCICICTCIFICICIIYIYIYIYIYIMYICATLACSQIWRRSSAVYSVDEFVL